MEDYLVHSIQSSLSLGLHDNARFLAERLVAADPCEARCWLLAAALGYVTASAYITSVS
jgi:hypothetical protein